MKENREVKSDVFSMLMENKEYALDVYNAVNNSNYDNPEDVKLVTLKRGISLSVRNDASFILDMNLNLYEHQSTYSPNMPLRSLIYVTNIYKPIADKYDIYGKHKIKLPTPKFICFYNGKEERPEKEVLRLSDSYEKETDSPELELICTVYNINVGNNKEILSKSKVLNDYMIFIDRIRYNESLGIERPIEEAIDWCVDQDILREFLLSRKTEVLKVMEIDMTFERREKFIFEDGKQEGIEEILLMMVKSGDITIERAAVLLGVGEEEFKKLM